MDLRGYQSALIEGARQSFIKGHKSVLLQAPTGAGKTAMLTDMFKTAAQRGRRCWFIVHRRELIEQSVASFNRIGLPHGVISAGHQVNPKAQVQICGIDTLRNRHVALPSPDFMCFDECHHLGAASWRKLYEFYPDSYKIGLTATPWRLDGTGLSDFFEDIIIGPRVRDLIDQGYLSDYKIYAPVTPDLSGIKTSMGDYVKKDLESKMSTSGIVGSAVDEYIKRASGKRAIVFAVSIQHSQTIVDQFNSRGIEAEHLDGTTHPDLRASAIARFRRGETLVLSNVSLFGEGFDLPDIEAVILMRPTKSLSLYLQMVGRAMRPTATKSHAIILDHSSNVLTHGLPCHEHEWTLEGRPKKPKTPGIKICPSCFAAQRSGVTECDECGYVFKTETRAREFSHEDGELNEIDRETFQSQLQKKQRRKDFWRQAYATHDYGDLLNLCREYGYKEGYAYYVWNHRKGKQRDRAT